MLILAMVGVSIVQVYILDNVFYEVASKKFPTEESFASFFGTFSAVASLLTWFALALATGPIMTRFGLKTSLQVAPIAILIGAAGATLAHVFRAPEFAVFWMIIGCKLADEVLNPAFNEASVSVLYQVLPAPQRARVRSLADGFTSPVCAGIAGALLLLMTGPMEMDYTKLLFALAIVVLLCVLVAWHLPVEYRASLSRGLANRQLQSIGDMLAESRGAEVIREGLQAKSASRVIYCLELLTEMGDESLRPALVSLLDHPDARVRSEALRRIERLESLDALGRVQSAADSDPESSVRGQALRTIAHFTGGEQLDLITPYLASPDRDIRKGALIGLIRSGGIAGILEAGHKLMGLVESEREDERALAAEVVGEIGIANFYQPLISLLADDSPRVRLTALIAASHLKSPQLAKPVLDCLSAPGMSASAVGALIAIGAPGLDRVAAQARAAQTSRDSLSFSRLAYVLGRVHSSRCVPLLLELAGESRARSRRALVEALTRHEYSAAGDNVVFPRLWVADEAEMITWNLTAANDLKHTPACELLVRGLYQDVDRRRESLIYLLALLYPAKLILRTRVHLHHRSADKRAMAVEMLDNVLDAGDKRLLLPLIDTDDRKVQQQRLAESGWMPQPPMTLTDRLRDVISTSRTDDEHWLRCAALHAIGKLRLEDLRAEVVELLATPGPIGIEATWALILMDAPDERTAKRHLKSMEGRQFLLTPVERVIFLKGVPIFAQLPDSDLLELSDRLREKEATPDTPILVKGEWGSSLYVLVTGEVRVHDGDREIARLGEGALFNELAALDPEPHAVSVTTTKDSLLFSLDSESLHELMNEHPQVGRGIMRVLCQRLREAVTAKNAPEPEHRLDPAARAGEAVASRV